VGSGGQQTLMGSERGLDLRRSRFLIVDDSEPSAELMRRILLGFGVTDPMVCCSAEDAWPVVSRERFDVILVDGQLPGQPGVEFIRRLRSDTRNPNFTAPMLLVSAYMPLSTILRARDAGASFVLTKPLSPAVLLTRIDWLARNTRDFISGPAYSGPDRRFRVEEPMGATERRASLMGASALIQASA
jgi:CheY-like chemotaxis protein